MKILTRRAAASTGLGLAAAAMLPAPRLARAAGKVTWTDRKSTRLNSSHT